MCAGDRTDRARRQTRDRPEVWLGRSLESLLDGLQYAVRVAVDLLRRHPGQALQVFSVGRGAADELHQRRLSHDFKGGPVHARTLDAPECRRVLARVCIPSAKVGHIGPRVKRELEGLRG